MDARDLLSARLQIRILRPTELAGRLDETERAAAYQPARLSATTYTRSALRAAEVDSIVERVNRSHEGEKPGALANTIRCLLAKVRTAAATAISVVRDPAGEIASVLAHVASSATGTTDIPVLRVRPVPLERTLIRQLLLHAIQTNAASRLTKLVISDAHLSNTIKEALLELGFEKSDAGWIRHTPASIGSREDLVTALRDGVDTSSFHTIDAAKLEMRFWPAKVLGENVATFVVPIIPTWAAQLFDSGLAETELFGALARLALNRENVYYRRPKNGSFTLPARILWYVSKEEGSSGTMAIRACSRLVSVETGPAKVLYSRYRRLGVYEWRDILSTAKGNPFGEIMALQFADTEQFVTPVHLETLRSLGITSTFQSPTRITEDQFARIYRLGLMSESS